MTSKTKRIEFRIPIWRDRLQPLDPQPALIDRAYQRLVEAIADGTLASGQRLRQEELGRRLGISRQPISHALRMLNQQKLVEENGRRGLAVSMVDPVRVRELYQVRTALDASLKRAICFCETLNGEGGYTVWGKLVPAERSLAEGALPIGLAHEVTLLRDIAAGEIVRWSNVAIPDTEAVQVRRAMEHRFAPAPAAVAAQ